MSATDSFLSWLFDTAVTTDNSGTAPCFFATSWLDVYDSLEELVWTPRWRSMQLHPTEISCHGRIKGKLKVNTCKIKRHRGYGRIITINGERMNIR
jgi:hypothetical protein